MKKMLTILTVLAIAVSFIAAAPCFAEDEEVPRTYENLICDPLVPLSFFQGKLDTWKAEAIAVLVENERLQDIKDRLIALGIKFGKYDSVEGVREFMNECGYVHTNTAVWIKEAFKEENIAILTCFESKKAKVDKDKIDKGTKDKADKDRKVIMKDYNCDLETGWAKLSCEDYK